MMFKEWLKLQEVIDPKTASELRHGRFDKNQTSHPACYFDHEGVEYVTYFQEYPLKDENWNQVGKYYMVSFQPAQAASGSAWAKTGLGNAGKALSNVIACVQNFIHKANPVIFGFEPAYPQLARLYAIILKKFANEINRLGYSQLPQEGKQSYFAKHEYKDRIAGIYGSVGPLLKADTQFTPPGTT